MGAISVGRDLKFLLVENYDTDRTVHVTRLV